MAIVLHLIYALADLGLLIWDVRLWPQANDMVLALLVLLLLASIYDNLIISAGCFLGEGEFLKSLNTLRFLFHDLLVPLFVVITVELAHQGGVSWAAYPSSRLLGWIIVLGMIGFGLITRFLKLDMAPVTFAGTLRYTETQNMLLPLAAILTTLLVIGEGVSIWRQLQWPWVFMGAVAVFLGNAAPKRSMGLTLSAGVECIFILCLLATEYQLQLVS
ncbi:MAG: hypothetical protein QNJ46_32285 [Leptolyngbyaceae cyanobacterium MO_188.B28]|nr:hypothetical protein [Leptolyngbyaceae cyanobacterium MO_188.B28]